MTFHTVFDAAAPHSSFVWLGAPGLVFVAIGIFLIFNPPLVSANFRGPRFLIPVFPWLFAGFGAFWTIMVMVSNGSQESRITQVISTHAYRTVEGTVENFRPLPPGGHGLESFTVRGVPFSYSRYRITQGFNASNGPIHEGLQVRIDYYNGLILKLEIADS